MKNFAPPATSALAVALFVMLTASCRHPDSARLEAPRAAADVAMGRRWHLAEETIGADSAESYKAGAVALRTLDPFGTMQVNELFYHGKLVMVPAGTLVVAAGPPPATAASAIQVRVLEGPQSGKTLWLYPESAERMGFAPTQTKR